MSDKYAFLRESLPVLVAEAASKGGYNPRAQMIIDLLADYDGLLSLNAELLEAATTVLDGLNGRIDMAVASGSHLPVYEGIAALHDAIAKARSQS